MACHGFWLLLLLLLGAARPVWAEQVPGASLPVSVGLYLQGFNNRDLEAYAGAFEIEAYLSLRWQNPQLAHADKRPRAVQPDQIQIPDLYVANAEKPRTPRLLYLAVEPDGTVRYLEHFAVRVNIPLNLSRFPFDTQRLRVQLRAVPSADRPLLLALDREATGRSAQIFLLGWQPGALTARLVQPLEAMPPGWQPLQQIDYELTLERQSLSSVINILLPMTLILMASWTVFWSRSFEANVVIVYSGLLAHIAFNIFLVSRIPDTPQLTYVDALVVCNYVFYFFAILATVFDHYLVTVRENHPLALVWARRWRRVIPAAFVLVNGLLALLFLVG